VQSATQRILIEIASADDVETGSLKRLCNQTRVIGGGFQRI
jgi:hypothetical protein